MLVERFEDLHCWQTARELTREIYQLTQAGEFARDFGLRDQIRRASVSILSNIAEGFESRTRKLFLEFLGRAKASGAEVRCQLYIALDVGHISQQQFETLFELVDKCIRQVGSLMTYLGNHPDPSSTRIRDD